MSGVATSLTSIIGTFAGQSGVRIEVGGMEDARGQHDLQGGRYPSFLASVLLLTPFTSFTKLLIL